MPKIIKIKILKHEWGERSSLAAHCEFYQIVWGANWKSHSGQQSNGDPKSHCCHQHPSVSHSAVGNVFCHARWWGASYRTALASLLQAMHMQQILWQLLRENFWAVLTHRWGGSGSALWWALLKSLRLHLGWICTSHWSIFGFLCGRGQNWKKFMLKCHILPPEP